MKIFITALTAGILLLYPFAIYFGLNYFQPKYLALVLMFFVSARIILVKAKFKKSPWVMPALTLGLVAIGISALTDTDIGFKLYPLAINFSMLIVFAYSYYKPPTVIETFARLSENDMPPEAIKYTTNVTLVWCLFFIFNGLVSLYTALFMSLDSWLIYNGFLSYILMGFLMLVEYLVRLSVKKNHTVSSESTIDESSEL